jgi:hypothetical protein
MRIGQGDKQTSFKFPSLDPSDPSRNLSLAHKAYKARCLGQES